jgi:hypothetical protein
MQVGKSDCGPEGRGSKSAHSPPPFPQFAGQLRLARGQLDFLRFRCCERFLHDNFTVSS